MPLEQLLTVAGRLNWRHRSWWVMGLAATVGGLLTNLALRGLAWCGADWLATNDLDVQALLAQLAQPAWLGAGVVTVFVLVLLAWLVSAVAEGGLIVVVAGRADSGGIGLARAIRAGAGLLGRFIAVDTFLFLPLFLLSLALMAIGFGVLAGIVLAVTGPGAEPADLLIVIGLGAAAAIPVLLLLLATSTVILIVRPLAFRAATVEGLRPAESIRRGWSVLRRHTLSVLVLALVLAAIRSLVGMPLRLATVVVAGASWWQIVMALSDPLPATGATGLLVGLGGLALAFLSWLISGIMNAYGSTAWTLSFETWIARMA